ncbi:MAG: N-acetyltransferase [Flavobacteriaceae bacterium]|nr:N-acetyltransferase [Flavobacteriaceae bacterium]
MKLKIRQEEARDYKKVAEIIENAFKKEHFSDHQEQFLVERLRNSKDFIPELSMVAELNGEVVGQILLSKIKISNSTTSFDSLALAPVSVAPEYQQQGIGGELIRSAHKKAKELGYRSILLLGHDTYYPRFGYELTSNYNISLPFDIPEKYSMILSLIEGGLDGVHGVVEYPEEFY